MTSEQVATVLLTYFFARPGMALAFAGYILVIVGLSLDALK